MKRELWHSRLLESLDELSDVDRQASAWVHRDLEFFPTATELLCQLFDDTGLDQLLSAGEVFSPPLDELLRKMSTLASQVDVELPAEQLLQDALWKELAAMAAQAYNGVNDVLDS